MNGKSRFREARLYLAGTTIALLLGTWSVLAGHDLSAIVNQTQTTGTSVTQSSSQASSQRSTTTTSTAHTRTRAS